MKIDLKYTNTLYIYGMKMQHFSNNSNFQSWATTLRTMVAQWTTGSENDWSIPDITICFTRLLTPLNPCAMSEFIHCSTLRLPTPISTPYDEVWSLAIRGVIHDLSGKGVQRITPGGPGLGRVKEGCRPAAGAGLYARRMCVILNIGSHKQYYNEHSPHKFP